MGYRLRVPAELGDWLVGLRESEPAAAAEVGAGVAALMAAEHVPCPPLAVAADTDDEPSDDGDPRILVDRAYQDMLGDLQIVRRHTAQAAAARKLAELRVTELSGQAGADPDELAAATSEHTAARRLEEPLTTISQRVQAEIDRFRTRKEAAKARYTAATAHAAVEQALAEAGEETDEAETAAAQQEIRDAAHGIEDLQADARAVKLWVGSVRAGAGEGGAARAAPEQPSPSDRSELLQLACDSLGTDIRILFAIDPPGTVTLLTVLEGPGAIAEDWDEAVTAAGMLLEVIRDAGWPPYAGQPDGGGLEFAGPAPFLGEYFGERADEIAGRAAEISARSSL